MNCDDFFIRWNSHVAGTLEPWRETEMQEHSRACPGCGKRWTEHDELCTAVDNVITAHRLPANLASSVLGKLKFPAVTRAARPSEAGPASGLPASAVSLAAAIGGLVLGYMLGGGGGQSSFEQLTQQALYGEMYGRGAGGSGRLLGLLNAMDVAQVVLGVVILLWITRTKIWEVLFPVNLPNFVRWARWLAIPACLLGALRVFCGLMMLASAGVNAISMSGSQDLGMWLTGATFLEPLWSLGFWLTLWVLLLGALNEAALRFARPLQ
jgi:hypothetical protein